MGGFQFLQAESDLTTSQGWFLQLSNSLKTEDDLLHGASREPNIQLKHKLRKENQDLGAPGREWEACQIPGCL